VRKSPCGACDDRQAAEIAKDEVAGAEAEPASDFLARERPGQPGRVHSVGDDCRGRAIAREVAGPPTHGDDVIEMAVVGRDEIAREPSVAMRDEDREEFT
jgi:hypothetical protein